MIRMLAIALLGSLAFACAGERDEGSNAPMDIGVAPEASTGSTASVAEDCRSGDAEACWSVALAHRFAAANNPEDADSPLRGLEGDASQQAVRDLLAPHCEAGHAPSCAEIASTFPISFGTNDPNRESNELMRKLYLERACDEGDTTSCTTLAQDFIADEQPDIANFYWLRACELGDSNESEAACKVFD